MKARDFLAIAKEQLNKTNPGPAEYRTCVNRSYYAIYNELVDLFVGFGVSLSQRSNCHSQVNTLLNSMGDTVFLKKCSDYNDLKNYRTVADYDLSDPAGETKRLAETAFKTANFLCSAIDVLKKDRARLGSVKSSVTNAAKNLR